MSPEYEGELASQQQRRIGFLAPSQEIPEPAVGDAGVETAEQTAARLNMEALGNVREVSPIVDPEVSAQASAESPVDMADTPGDKTQRILSEFEKLGGVVKPAETPKRTRSRAKAGAKSAASKAAKPASNRKTSVKSAVKTTAKKAAPAPKVADRKPRRTALEIAEERAKKADKKGAIDPKTGKLANRAKRTPKKVKTQSEKPRTSLALSEIAVLRRQERKTAKAERREAALDRSVEKILARDEAKAAKKAAKEKARVAEARAIKRDLAKKQAERQKAQATKKGQKQSPTGTEKWMTRATATLTLGAVGAFAALGVLKWREDDSKEIPRVLPTVSASPTPTPEATPVTCAPRWEIKDADHGENNRWFANGIKAIKDAKTDAEATAASMIWLDKVKLDPELLAASAKTFLGEKVDASDLRGSDGCITAKGEQLATEVFLVLSRQSTRIKAGLAFANGYNTGAGKNGEVTIAEEPGVTGDRKALVITFQDKKEHVHVVCIMGRCGQFVFPNKVPGFLSGPTDQKGSGGNHEIDNTSDDAPNGYDQNANNTERPKDTDKDGVYDKADNCITKPEDKDGFEDEDGCPEPEGPGTSFPTPSESATAKPSATPQPTGTPTGDDN